MKYMTDIDKSDYIIDNMADMTDAINCLGTIAKQKEVNTEHIVFVDDNGNDSSVIVYGFYYYTWLSTDTLDSVASRLLHNASYGTLIAYYNNIKNEASIVAGTRLKVPQLQETKNSSDNKIYAPPDMQDSYGIDIAIDDNGDIGIQGSDTATISGVDNLTQALCLRLSTASNKRVRLTAYGIRQTIGDLTSVQSYLLSSIEQTLKQDPRVKEINNISLTGKKDALYINVAYIDINNNKNNVEAVL